FSIFNLPPEYQYHMSDLMYTSILLDPKEQNPDQIQLFLQLIISDLLQLWQDGIKVPTESCTEVILVAIVCDKPAAHTISGFASHSHTNFCTCYWITFKVCTNAQHHELDELYCNLMMPNACKTFVKDFVTHYMQLLCLPYFNIVEQVIIDPMYNLFLGKCTTLP
ncbi:hypothetical protein BDR06DRAFT_873436, partial [Suillus hirtellus]